MENRKSPIDPIEDLWLETQAARDAGVFRSTRVDAVHSGAAPPIGRTARMPGSRGLWLGVAAALLLVAGVWTMLFRMELVSLRQRAGNPAASSHTTPTTLATRFAACLQGPAAGPVSADCASQDIDADGDVDLRDFSRRLALVTRNP